MIKKIILATNNKHKIDEFKTMFKPYDVDIVSLNEASIVCNPVEDGLTFEDNALIKAKAISDFVDLPIISDDSGLVIRSLNGFPGVYSARFMENSSYDEKRKEIIDRLNEFDDKSAEFNTVLCLYNVFDKPIFFKGKVDGVIVSPSGDNGFAYDPIFYSNELKKTFGDATNDEKNSVSHRSRALNELINYLLKNKMIAKKGGIL